MLQFFRADVLERRHHQRIRQQFLGFLGGRPGFDLDSAGALPSLETHGGDDVYHYLSGQGILELFQGGALTLVRERQEDHVGLCGGLGVVGATDIGSGSKLQQLFRRGGGPSGVAGSNDGGFTGRRQP